MAGLLLVVAELVVGVVVGVVAVVVGVVVVVVGGVKSKKIKQKNLLGSPYMINSTTQNLLLKFIPKILLLFVILANIES